MFLVLDVYVCKFHLSIKEFDRTSKFSTCKQRTRARAFRQRKTHDHAWSPGVSRTMATAGESQIQRIIRDLHDCVLDLTKEYKENGEPITDDSTNLHKFSYKLEYLLQFGQKEKSSFLGMRKDYWDYFSDCLAKIKGANDGIRFVKSIPELKTSLGKGRAFIRYSLVHQRLADTLQQCLLNQKVTSDWYYTRSPFLNPRLNMDIVNSLYELNEVKFDVASRGHDLDSDWPTFARRTLGMTSSPSHMWKAPSRSSSINSLASSYSQANEFPCSPEFGHSLLNESAEPLSTVDELRLELDQSELKQRELVEHVQQLGIEATELRVVVTELQRQLDVSLAAQSNHQELQFKLEVLSNREQALAQDLEVLQRREAAKEAANMEVQAKLAAAEKKNEKLMSKLDVVLEEKGLKTASQFDSAQKIHELLDGLKEAEKGRLEALAHAEEKSLQAERLAEELRMKQQVLRDGEDKMATLTEKGTKLVKQAEEQRNAMDKLQEELLVREKEASSLQKDLQDLQHCLEAMEQQAAEEKKRAMEEREVLQKKLSSLKESLEGKVQNLKAQLKGKETELLVSKKKIQHLEGEAVKIVREKHGLSESIGKLESHIKDQSRMIEEYKEQCSNLTEMNSKLLRTVTKNEDTKKELIESKSVLEIDLAELRASEKQLRGLLDDAKVTVDEREQRMREENRSLDEKLQKASMQVKESESVILRLEQENADQREEHLKTKGALTAAQDELRKLTEQVKELKSSLEVASCNEANLTVQLKEQHSQLEDRERLCEELQERLDELEAQEGELEAGKAEAERALEKQREMIERLVVQKNAVEKAQLEMSACRAKETHDVASKVALLEEQLALNVKEVSRLQEEVIDLKAKLLLSEEEKVKIQTKLEITEALQVELQTLIEQLKKQAEEQNRNHISELLQSKQHLQELSSELHAERSALGKISADFARAKEDLAVLKTQNEQLVMENAENREGLHGANKEMAELGMTICRLTAEREEAQERWVAQSNRIRELEEQDERQTDRLNASMASLRQENTSLREELVQMEKLPGTVLELKEMLDKSESERDVAREETAALRFQMSSENMAHKNLLKSLNEELESLKAQLKSESEKTSSLEVKAAELEQLNSECSRLMGEKDLHIAKSKSLIRCGEDEIQQLKERMTCVEEALAVVQTERDELKEKMEKIQSEAQVEQIKMAAEIEDLGHVKTTLEERLIELIREKDVLWQKSDALEFEQKQRAEERWWLVDREATHCLSCNSHFTWWLRKHHCRLCGRIFCYYCSNNFVSTRSGGKKERCCRECYTQHSAVVERFTSSEINSSAPDTHAANAPPYIPTPRVTVTEPNVKLDDGVFDIITDEEVNRLYESDTHSQNTDEAHDEEAESQNTQDLGISGDTVAVEEQEEMPSIVQDAEIHLLKSGELGSSVLLHIDEIRQFGEASRELFIKSSCYSVVSVTVHECGHAIGWVFSSEQKSICFSVVYKESVDTPEEQTKVLIPLTRCNSHKETIQGQLKARNPGVYTLIFDNSYSRFISKKVNYHLTTEKPVIYDGSDCL